jgi:LAGLIDADG endonuclease.
MAGFVTGEGCFLIQMAKYGKDKSDGVSLSFKVSQHLRDELLLRSFISFLDVVYSITMVLKIGSQEYLLLENLRISLIKYCHF